MSTTIDTLCYTRSPDPSPLGLATQLGWFLEEFQAEGIRVFSLEEAHDPSQRDAHLQGYLTRAIRQGGHLQAIWARSRGGDTRVIGVNWLPEYKALIALPGSGIRTPADLAGRRIGLPLYDSPVEGRRGESLLAVLSVLRLGGVSPSEITLHSVRMQKWGAERGGPPPPGDHAEYTRLVEALFAGTVDAILVKGPRGLHAARAAQAHVVADLHAHPDPLVRAHNRTPRLITVEASLLRDRPDLVERFLARVVDVDAWARRHAAETRAYYAKESHSTVDEVLAAHGPQLHLEQQIELDEASLEGLDACKRFMLDWGFIHEDFDLRAWVDPRPLSAVRARLPAR